MDAIDKKLAAQAARAAGSHTAIAARVTRLVAIPAQAAGAAGRPTASAVDDVLGATDLSVKDILPKRLGAARHRHA
jgi:hypothetical protein